MAGGACAGISFGAGNGASLCRFHKNGGNAETAAGDSRSGRWGGSSDENGGGHWGAGEKHHGGRRGGCADGSQPYTSFKIGGAVRSVSGGGRDSPANRRQEADCMYGKCGRWSENTAGFGGLWSCTVCGYNRSCVCGNQWSLSGNVMESQYYFAK